MGPTIYMLGCLTTTCCAVLLLRYYARVRHKLLLWSGLCFVGLAVSNLLIFVDLVLLPNVDLYFARLLTAALAMLLLLYGLIWESE